MPKSISRFQRDEGIETKYTSLWLEPSDKKEPTLIYCMFCRCPLFQYKGDLVSIMPGNTPVTTPLIQCRNKNCGHKYYIHSIVKEDRV